MRSNIDIFTMAIAPYSARLVTGFDSALNTGSCSIGLIQGQYRSLNAIVTESVSDGDQWHIVNLKGGSKEKPEFDSIAVLGVVDHQQACDLSLLHFGRMFDAAVVDVTETSQHGLMRHLSTAHYHKSKNMIAAWQLEKLQDVTSAVIPQWDDINFNSHQGSTAHLLLDMQRHDDYSELLEKSDNLPTLLASLNAVQAEFDSIIVEQQYLEHLMSLLHKAMETASGGGVKVTQTQGSNPFEVSEVFRHKKVLNIAVSYDFDDGQSIAIVFHNPDRGAKKISPQDTLISWKIMMNKRDITAAIQPNQGEGITMPVLAGRIMKLINQNSARFKRTQAKKAENAQALADTIERIQQKQTQSDTLDSEIKDLLNQIDALVPNSHAVAEFEQDHSQRAQTLPQEQERLSQKFPVLNQFLQIAKDRGYTASIGWGGAVASLPISGRMTPLTVTFSVSPRLGLETDQDVGKIKIMLWQDEQSEYEYIEEFDATENNIAPAFNEAEKYIANLQTSKPKIVTKKEAETVYNALNDRHKGLTGGTPEEFLAQNYPSGLSDELQKAKALLERPFNKAADQQIKSNIENLIQLVEETTSKWEEAMKASQEQTDHVAPGSNQADLDYLNDIIAGRIGFEDAEAVEQQLEEIAERLTPEIEPLFEQAVDMYSDYHVNQGATI